MKLEISGYKKFKIVDIKNEYTYEELKEFSYLIQSLEDELTEKMGWIEDFLDKYNNLETWLGDPEFKDNPDDPDEWSIIMSHFYFVEHIYGKKHKDFTEKDLKYGNHDIYRKIKELYEKEFGIIDKRKMSADPEHSCLYIYFYDKEEAIRYLNWSYEKFIKPTVNEWKKELKYNKENKMT